MRKLVKVLILLLIVLFFSIGCVYATGFSFLATANKTEVKPGDTISINLNIADIDAGELGINTIEAVLEYDKNVFEPITSSDFTGANNWSITYNNETGENEGKFVAVIVQTGVTEDQNIGTLNLKVKSGVSKQTTKISFTNIKTNDGSTEISTADQNISVEIKASENTDILPNQDSDQNGNKNQGQSINDGEKDTMPEEENRSPNVLPQTGSYTYLILIACGILVIISIIGYIKYNKNKDID